MNRTCTVCSRPLGHTDTTCPSCATPVPLTAATARRVLVDDPVGPERRTVPAPAPSVAPARPAPPAPPPPSPVAPVTAGRPTITGTITGAIRRDHRRAGPTLLLRAAGVGDRTVEVHRFRVTAVTGETADCELVGRQVGGELRRGDIVEIDGRRTRNGTVRVRTATVVADGSRVHGRPGLAVAVARAVTVLAAAVLVVAVVAVTLLVDHWAVG